ncbi:MAG: choice-of-anchor D domain-containing protein [Candidatus Kapabacteria bacterium]|nr:choice-of-anchor D domain-containing protein [Candidatus Kapabacteria bacterium]
MMIYVMISVVTIFLAFTDIQAQTAAHLVPIRTFVTGDDTVKCRLAALDNNFQPVNGNLAALQVVDGGVTPAVTQAPDPIGNPRELSLVVAVDLSSSMEIASPTTSGLSPLAIASQAIDRARNLMIRSFDELGLVGIGARSELIYALSSDKLGFPKAVTSLKSSGGFDLQRGLFDSPTGALTQLQNSRNSRALLLFTDGNSRFDLKSARSLAKTFGIKVYVIGIGTALSSELRTLADSSGGAYVERVSNVAEASRWASGFVAEAKQLRLWTLSWARPNACDTIRQVQVADTRTKLNVQYRQPPSKRGILQTRDQSIDLGLVPAGNAATATAVWTASNTKITVTAVSASGGTGFELIDLPSLPVTVSPGTSMSVGIRFSSQSTDADYATVQIQSDACQSDVVHLRAGSVFSGKTVRLEQPNGGETFLAGRDTVVQWTNALPQDFMRLEVSTNSGTTWKTVTESAQGLSYKWSPGFGVGDNCLMRITGTNIDQRSILRLRGQEQPVYCAIFTPDDQYVITGGDDGTVRTWDANTGEQARIIGIHGNWVWALATMPGTSNVASGSHDGTVRVWDYRSSARIATVNVGSRVWSVAFSQDGKTMFVGTEGSIMTVSTDTWSIDKFVTVPEGPVYDVHAAAGAPFIVAAEGSSVVSRSVSDLAVIREFRDPEQVGSVYAVSMPSTNDVVVSGGSDFVIRKYRYSDASLLESSSTGLGSILALSYSLDNSKILSAGGDATAKIHSAENLSVQVALAGHDGIVYGASFSSNDSLVATASTDFTTRVWPLSKLGSVSDQSDGAFSIAGGQTEQSTLSFGDVLIGTGRDVSSPVLRNTGSSPVVVRSIRLRSAGQDSDFEISPPTLPLQLESGASLSVDVEFMPTGLGDRNATLEITTGTGIKRIELSGRGVNPGLSVREVLDFGRHIANQGVIDSSITVTGIGDPSVLYEVTLTSIVGEQSSVFSIIDGGSPFTLRGGESRKISVRFDPRTFGRFSGNLVLQISGRPTQIVRLYSEATGEGRLSSTAGLLFASNSCEAVSSQRPVMLRNSGNAQTIIYSIGLEGADADEFSIDVNQEFPITMNSRDSLPFTVSFAPKRVGGKDVRIVVSSNASNAMNGRTVVNISARRDSVGFELSRSTIRFDNALEGEVLSDRLQIINTGTITLQWPRGSINLGPFRIDSIAPDLTAGGRTSAMLVTFLGGVPGRTYDTSYTFVDTICGRRQTLRLTASVKSIIGATLKIGSLATNTGQLVSLPVYVTGKVNLNRTQVRTVTAHMSVNGTVLTPSGSTPAGQLLPGGIRHFSVPIPLDATDSLATTLTFQTTWGNDTASFVRIDSVTAGDTLTLRTMNGQIRILDICRIGSRPRLISFTNSGAGIAIAPNPASTSAIATIDVIERGSTDVRVFDAAGRLIQTLFSATTSPGRWVVPLDVSGMQMGVYFVVMTTPSESFTHRIEVVR